MIQTGFRNAFSSGTSMDLTEKPAACDVSVMEQKRPKPLPGLQPMVMASYLPEPMTFSMASTGVILMDCMMVLNTEADWPLKS